jgi:hypothetical protein
MRKSTSAASQSASALTPAAAAVLRILAAALNGISQLSGIGFKNYNGTKFFRQRLIFRLKTRLASTVNFWRKLSLDYCSATPVKHL